MRREIGTDIFSDSKIGEGELHVTGTRIPVVDALQLVAQGLTPAQVAESISQPYYQRGGLSEAITLASEALETPE